MSGAGWTYKYDDVMDFFVLVSPAGRRIGEIDERADAISLCDLLNDGLKFRQSEKLAL